MEQFRLRLPLVPSIRSPSPPWSVGSLDVPLETFLAEATRTNNHEERTNRMFRLLEKVRSRWRCRRTLVRFVVLMLDEVWRGWSPVETQRAEAPEPGRSDMTQVPTEQRSRRATPHEMAVEITEKSPRGPWI